MRQRPRKPYPTDELDALTWLRQVAYWLKVDIDGSWHWFHTLSPSELLGKIEALAIVEFAQETIKTDLHNRAQARLGKQRNESELRRLEH